MVSFSNPRDSGSEDPAGSFSKARQAAVKYGPASHADDSPTTPEVLRHLYLVFVLRYLGDLCE